MKDLKDIIEVRRYINKKLNSKVAVKFHTCEKKIIKRIIEEVKSRSTIDITDNFIGTKLYYSSMEDKYSLEIILDNMSGKENVFFFNDAIKNYLKVEYGIDNIKLRDITIDELIEIGRS